MALRVTFRKIYEIQHIYHGRKTVNLFGRKMFGKSMQKPANLIKRGIKYSPEEYEKQLRDPTIRRILISVPLSGTIAFILWKLWKKGYL